MLQLQASRIVDFFPSKDSLHVLFTEDVIFDELTDPSERLMDSDHPFVDLRFERVESG